MKARSPAGLSLNLVVAACQLVVKRELDPDVAPAIQCARLKIAFLSGIDSCCTATVELAANSDGLLLFKIWEAAEV